VEKYRALSAGLSPARSGRWRTMGNKYNLGDIIEISGLKGIIVGIVRDITYDHNGKIIGQGELMYKICIISKGLFFGEYKAFGETQLAEFMGDDG
jgi:hypothetical protein